MKFFVHLGQVLILLLICGCAIQPRPHRFVDTTDQPPSFHAAWSDRDKLLLDIAPVNHGGSFYGMEVFSEHGDLYVYPNYETLFTIYFPISTVHSKLHMERKYLADGTNGVYRFTIDPAKFGLQPDWPEHIFWVAYPDMYPFPMGGFWSDKYRHPTFRRQLEVRPLQSGQSLQPAAAAPGS